ncbi:GntR family transcriptional regulator [Marinomonas shanghaiensis]|uniref:GntR family transcriptional regulator n=1 Tax=Marinomonas shanghaiensis TaxID=2202418 RepID=UPI003A90D0FC
MDISEKIKNDILNSRLPKGQPLRQKDLSVRYSVSRIPVRDALLSLKAEGWLVPNGKAGVMIPDLNWQEAEDLSFMRAELECQLLKLAFDHITQRDIAAARDFLEALNEKNLTLIHRGELNWCFHDSLYRAADRPTLHREVERLNRQAVRYLGFQYGPLAYRQTSQHQHEALLGFVESRNKHAALVLLRQHIEEAGALLANYLKERD